MLHSIRHFHTSLRRMMAPPTLMEILERTIKSKEVSINGWVTNVRKMKNFTFLDVSDGSSLNHLQLVVPAKKCEQSFLVGSAVSARGKVGETKTGQLEMQVADIELKNTCLHPQYPFAGKQQYPQQYARQHLHLRARHKPFSAMLRVRHTAQKAFHDYFDAEGYINVHTPILTANDCEGSGEVFVVKPENPEVLKEMQRDNIPLDDAYFDHKAFLTVSGQLHLEAMAAGFRKVYNFNPAFRAENSKSAHHLAEFYMIEAEIAFINETRDVTSILEETVKAVTKQVLEKRATEIEFLIRQTREYGYESLDKEFAWLNKEFLVLSYTEAISILRNHKEDLKTPPDEDAGLNKEHEQYLIKYFDNCPLFVIYWPAAQKPFYMRRTYEIPWFCDCFDLLVPEVGELAGGSVRETDLEKLQASMPDPKSLEWYLDLRRYGSATTGGYGLGFERYLQWVLQVKNIRDVIPFPRWPHHCET